MLLFEEAYSDQQALDLFLALRPVDIIKFLRIHSSFFKRTIVYGPQALIDHCNKNPMIEGIIYLTHDGFNLLKPEGDFSLYIREAIIDGKMTEYEFQLVCSYLNNFEAFNRATALFVINAVPAIFTEPFEPCLCFSDFKGIGPFLSSARLIEEEKMELFRSYGKLFPCISGYLSVEPRLLEAIPSDCLASIQGTVLDRIIQCPLGHYFLARYRPDCQISGAAYNSMMPLPVFYSLALFCPSVSEARIYDIKCGPVFLLEYIESLPSNYVTETSDDEYQSNEIFASFSTEAMAMRAS